MNRSMMLITLLVAAVAAHSLAQKVPTEDDYYPVETLPLPKGMVLEVSGIAMLSDGRPLVCTRRGEVWIVEDAYAKDPAKATFKRFADGLQEPLGLLVHEGWIWFVQRGELSRMRDTDGDDIADEFETVCDDWRISGNYHEYNFGPRIGPDGKLWITTNKPFGGEPFGRADWRGYAISIDPKTKRMTPVSCGLRSPAGVQNSPWGDVFYTDNQGEWCGASKLSHLEPGDFHGHPWGVFSTKKDLWGFHQPKQPPNGKRMPEVGAEMPTFKLPAVWFPYDKMGKSPAGFVWDDTSGKFGPFDGQLFVSDQHHAWVFRTSLEKVNGHWQGACYPFRGGLQCGAIRVAWGKDRKYLFVGQTQRGWGSRGGKPFGIQRISWTGKVPFEIQAMTAQKSGFDLTFTKPVDVKSASDVKSYRMESYTYLLHSSYGSKEVDKGTPIVKAAMVSSDGRRVRLTVQGLRAGYVHEVHPAGVRSKGGAPLLHPHAYYTLINIPGGASAQPPRRSAGQPPAKAPDKAPVKERAEVLIKIEDEAPIQDEGFVDLFDGKTTDGWFNPYEWGQIQVENGEIHLRANRKFFLTTKKTYSDFILEVDVNVPNGGNSGIQFRSEWKKNKVFGYQAEVDPSKRAWAGGIYDEGRRAWLAPLRGKPKAQAAFKPEQWNRYRIHAEGGRLRVWVNDVLTSDYRDAMTIEGHIALQHHGEKGKLYRFRRVRLKDLGRHRWRPLFDGKTLSGWHARPGGTWNVENAAIVGRSPADERRHGLLVTDAIFKDFTVRARFKVHTGDSGFYFRIKEVKGNVSAKGFQVEIDTSEETGGLYETGGRAWVNKPAKRSIRGYKSDRWNQLELHAHAGHIVVKINGKVTSELKNDPGRKDGHLAVQLHGGQAMHVEYKDIQVLERAPGK
ncbi:MAG: hypothetical protein CMJ83_06815 [Planctomycetes bacterium]|nr:hypothetical protein [Planctomycetota bacterium]